MIKITDKQRRLIEKGILSLATCDLENRPNVVAVSYCKVVEGDKILITDNYMNKTKANLSSCFSPQSMRLLFQYIKLLIR